MMTELIGTEVNYFLTQVNANDGTEMPVMYNAYNGSFGIINDANSATRFPDEATARNLATAQNTMAGLLGYDFTYEVVKQEITRTKVNLTA